MCSWFEGIQVLTYRLSCMDAGWHVLAAAVLAALIAALCALWALTGASGTLQRLGAALVIASAFCLSFAAGLPELEPQLSAPPGGRIVVLVDASESVRRGGDALVTAAKDQLVAHLRRMAEAAPPDADWTGSVYAFGAAPRILTQDVALRDLASNVAGATLGPVADNSNVQTALDAALQDISSGPGAGMVMLVTDGIQSQGDASKAVSVAQETGIPIHILPIGSEAPSKGLLSHNIGPDQAIGRPAILRATVQGTGQLMWGINGSDEPVQPVSNADRPKPIRLEIEFAERGLNFANLGYAVAGQDVRQELAYTLVRGPARVLAYGNAAWLDGADPDKFLIERALPSEDKDPSQYDAVVIDALEPSDFADDMPQRLLSSAAGGVGLFIVNGPLRGSHEDMQRLSDWEQTELAEVLPVNSDPAEYIEEPPKRDVLIIIDTSGSMGGGNNMPIARAAAGKVLDSLRPQDSITILPFSTDALTPYSAARATPGAVEDARRFVRSLRVAGGTYMNRALAAANDLRGNNCALFIIGDGGYEREQVTVSPICQTTAIGVAGAFLPGIDTSWGQPIKVSRESELGAINYQVFKPEPRTTFWENGPLQVVAIEDDSPFVISRPVAGVALSYPRPESTDLSIIADPPRSPVLAFRRDPVFQSLRTGVFLGTVPNGLRSGPDGWATAVLTKLVGWDDPDRFGIDFQLNGEDVTLRVTSLGEAPVPAKLSASIQLDDGTSSGIPLGSADDYGVFEGKGRISLSNTTRRGTLNLELGNGDVQAIPLQLPQRELSVSNTSSLVEAFGFGVDILTLSKIQTSTGGIDLRRSSPDLARDTVILANTLLWPWIAGLGALLFAMSLFLGGVRR